MGSVLGKIQQRTGKVDARFLPPLAAKSRPCKRFISGCTEDHCFNCARHLDGNSKCPKGCGNHGDEHDDKVSGSDQDNEP